jgi:hypothetical protein
MRAITIAMLIGFRCSVFAGLFDSYYSSGQMDHKQYEFKISQGDILRTPVWASDVDFPPLSTRKAQEIARQQMQELRGGAKPHWELRETTIADMGDGMHSSTSLSLSHRPMARVVSAAISCVFAVTMKDLTNR